MIPFTEDTVEQAALEWLSGLGYGVRFGGDIAPGEPAAERASYDEVLLFGRLRDEIAFFQAVRASFAKHTPVEGPAQDDLDHAVKQLVSQAVVSDQVIDIFETAGLKAPDVSILSDEFLEDVRDLPQKNLALELLRKLLNDEITSQARTNLVQARSFADLLDSAVRRHQDRH